MPTPDRLPSGRLERLVKPAALGLRGVAGAAGTWVRTRGRPSDARDAARTARAVTTAREAAALMGEMKGAVMKLGQMLSFADTSVLPPEVQEVLAQLQADAPPMAWELVEDVVRRELGEHPDRLFARFSRVPIAAASIGQVHSASLADGTELVVKVQYPGVAEAIEADLRNTALLSTLATFGKSLAGPYAPRTDIKAVVAELRDRVVEELDYTLEAENQRRFAALWAGDPAVRIPEVLPELSTSRVLTQHYHDGMRWSAAVAADQDLRDRWAQTIYRFVFTSLYRHRVFNADPHPGNYLFHDDGAVSFLDFGCVRTFERADVDGLRAMAWAIVDQDPDALFAAMDAGGWYPRKPRASRADILRVLTPGWAPIVAPQPFTFTREWAEQAVRLQLGLAPGDQRIVAELAPPPQYLFLARITVGLFSVLTGLGATGDWLRLFSDIEGRPDTGGRAG